MQAPDGGPLQVSCGSPSVQRAPMGAQISVLFVHWPRAEHWPKNPQEGEAHELTPAGQAHGVCRSPHTPKIKHGPCVPQSVSATHLAGTSGRGMGKNCSPTSIPVEAGSLTNVV